MATRVQETDLVKTRLPRGSPFDAWSLGPRITLVLATTLAYIVAFLSLYYLVDRPIAVMSLIPAAASGWLLGLRGGLLGGLLVALLNFSLFGLVEGLEWHTVLHGTIAGLLSAGTGPLFGWLSQLFDKVQRQSGELASDNEFLIEQMVERRRAEEALRRAENELEMRVEQRTAELSRANEELHREITERRRSEGRLRDSEAKFRAVLETSVDAVVSADNRGNVVYANLAAERMFGYSPGEMHGRLLKELLSIGAFRVMGKTVELAGRRKDKSEFPVELTTSTWKTEAGVFFTGIIRDISERREAEEMLSQLAAIVESSEDAIIGTTVSGIITSWNQGAEKMFGYPPDEVIGHRVSMLAPTEMAGEAQSLIDRVRRGEAVGGRETVRVRKDGQHIDVSITVSPIRDSAGEIIGASGIMRNVTERKRAEAGLRESEEKFRTVLETAVDGVVSVDTRGEIAFANKACERMFGYGEGELVGKALLLLIPERFHRGHQEGFKRLLATGESRVLGKTLELAGRRRDGSEFPLELALATWQAGGSVFFTGVVRDITERRHAERALHESEYRYRLVAENATDVIWVRDLELRVRYISPSVERLRGYSVEEAMAQPIGETLTQASCDIALKALADALAMVDEEDPPPFFSRTLELEVRRKDGSTVWTESMISFLRDEDGRPIAILGVTRDISERKRAEETLRESEKLAAMGELLAGVAHELNNPLSVIIGETFLLRQAVQSGLVAKRAAAIGQSAERCSRIVRNFLSLARRRPTERQAVRINQVVEDTVELLAYELQLGSVEVNRELAEDLPLLGADPYQLQQVLVNLVVNALHAMRQTNGPRRLTLRSRFDPAEGRLLLEVTDTGPGIPEEVQARIFEPFFTTKPAGEGTGLGLSLCQGIVKEHGGRISVESAPGKGAIFRIELPVVAPPESELTAQAAQPLPLTAAKTVLVVDDEPEISRLLVDVLSADKHRVETAPNGVLALRKLEERRYDLILCDIRMPELDGPGFYRKMARRHPALQRRVIFITGDALTASTRSFLEKTGAPCLEKPFDLVELRQMIQRIVQRA